VERTALVTACTQWSQVMPDTLICRSLLMEHLRARR
jgi:hypothetical protein